jgi:hypothetical protein
LESAAGDRAHDAREVDLNPHLGVGLPIVYRLELHSPARRGSTHWPGECHGAGRLDSRHLLAPAVRQPEYPLRSLLHPRAGLKRGTAANPAFEHRWRPLRPASDVTDVRPHVTDAAGDFYAALGPDCHEQTLLITSGLREISRDAISLTETPASALRWREDQANLAAQAWHAGVNVSHACEATFGVRADDLQVVGQAADGQQALELAADLALTWC